MKYKSTAIIRLGYEYQDLVGIELLTRYFRDPNLFDWVELEQEDKAAPGLDDIVAKRPDGSTEYYQVKFTVDPNHYELDWGWLLKKKPRGTSLLAKWVNGLERAHSSGPVVIAQLETNRRPAPEFDACLKDRRVQLDRLEATLRTRVEDECGGARKAAEFFALFTFEASKRDLPAYEQSLRSNLVHSDTTDAGWLLLVSSVRDWSRFSKDPAPDGKIRWEHIAQILSKRRPQPLRQDFQVPPGYRPPDAQWDGTIQARIADPATPLTIVWGSPGRGKSTYLSSVAESLQKGGQVVIRHHYFLPSDTFSERRPFFSDIANSLMAQLRSQMGEDAARLTGEPDKLRAELSKAAAALAAKSQALVLIVDGLDHVWRDIGSTDQLNHLFNALLPLPPNLRLLVGTQRVADDQLPRRLLAQAQPADWHEISPLDEAAVHLWVERQDQDRRFTLRPTYDRAAQISAIASALFRHSRGHPLLLIYALESLIRQRRPFDADDVERLPGSPGGDIRDYYQKLWIALSPNSRRILHSLASSEFHWPGEGVRQALGEYHEIEFLLEPRHSGLIPFHSSLFAWVRARADHDEAARAVLPAIVRWLKTDAPPYWRWGWLWIAQLKAGDPRPLLDGATRKWALDSLAAGWPVRQVDRILGFAERAAFDASDYALTVALRAIKVRVLNASEFQTTKFGRFEAVALSTSSNVQQARNQLEELQDWRSEDIVELARHGPASLRPEIVDGCIDELARRVNLWLQLRHTPGHEFVTLANQLLACAALTSPSRIRRALKFAKGFTNPGPQILYLIEELEASDRFESLKALRPGLAGQKWQTERDRVNDAIARVAVRTGAEPGPLLAAEPTLPPFAMACLKLTGHAYDGRLSAIDLPKSLPPARYGHDLWPDLRTFLTEAFWIAVGLGGSADGDVVAAYPGMDIDGLGWAAETLDPLERTGLAIGSGKADPAFLSIYEACADLGPAKFSNADASYMQSMIFKDVALEIALDLHALRHPKSSTPVSKDELEAARGSVHWMDWKFVAELLRRRSRLVSEEAAKLLFADLIDEQAGKASEFNERSDNWTDLASAMAQFDPDQASVVVRRAADCLLGYGWRKDVAVFDAIEAIELVHDADPTRTWPRIRQLAPFIETILDFTDGSETRHAPFELARLVGVYCPDRLPALYRWHIAHDQWALADECLHALLKRVDYDSAEAGALASALVDAGSLDILKSKAASDLTAKALYDRQAALLGGVARPKPERGTKAEAERKRPNAKVDIRTFKPTHLGRLIRATAFPKVDFDKGRELRKAWLSHWHKRGEGETALKSLEKILKSGERTTDVEDMLDTAFGVALDTAGRESAYPWIVRAHIHRRGWASYWVSESEVHLRLETAAVHYPDRWKEFIRDTSRPPTWLNFESFAIGTKTLVRFLVRIGETAAAAAIADTLIETLLAEVSDQPLEVPEWAH